MTRTKISPPAEAVGDEIVPGAFKLVLNLLDIYPRLHMRAPMIQTQVIVWKIISRLEATKA